MTPQELGPIQIGDFHIEKQLGAGGMGIVYLARQISLDRLVALKVLGRPMDRPSDIARFRREAQAVARLKHPNIATVHFVGQDDKLCYMAMEYVDGVSLREVIERLSRTTNPDSSIDDFLQFRERVPTIERFDQPAETEDYTPQQDSSDMDPYRSPEAEKSIFQQAHVRRCCEIVHDAALALEHAHKQCVIHRDIKPDNLMLGRDGRVYIIDFGVARFFEDATLTQTGALVGTPMYMSPEQVTARGNLDHRTDIYSLGLVLYELLALVPPITAPTREGVLRKIVTKQLIPVSWHNGAVPPRLRDIVHMAAAKDPDKRYKTVEEFASDIQRHLEGGQVLAPRYQYESDESEVIARRPPSAVCAAFCMFYSGLVMLCLALGALSFGIRIPLVGSGGIASCVFLGLGWLVLRANRAGYKMSLFSNGVASVVLLVCLLISPLSPFLFIPTIPIGLAFIASPLCLTFLLQRKTRDWISFAEHVRRDESKIRARQSQRGDRLAE